MKDWRHEGGPIGLNTRASAPGRCSITRRTGWLTQEISASVSPWPPTAWTWSTYTGRKGGSAFSQRVSCSHLGWPTGCRLLPVLNFKHVSFRKWPCALSGPWHLGQLLGGRLGTWGLFHLLGDISDHIMPVYIWDFILLKVKYNFFWE